MTVSELDIPRVSTRPGRTEHQREPVRFVVADRCAGGTLASVASDESESVTPGSPVRRFTEGEAHSFQNDDAMAAGMIGAILGLAFLVLLALTVGVTVWTLNVAG
jgi:hypothetical protein